MTQPPAPLPQPPTPQGCYRHPDRATLILCQRCRRPVCPECMVTAHVGVQCPECVRDGARATRAGEAPFGGQRSTNPRLTSLVLIGLNVAVFVAALLTGGAFGRVATLLAITPRGACLVDDGSGSYYPGIDQATCAAAQNAYWVDGVAGGALWQVLTNAFTHVEVTHLAMNLLALYFVGPPLEQVLGRSRFLCVYLVSAIAAAAAVMWLADPESSALGASGAIFGVLGALMIVARKAGGNYRMILAFLGLNVVITVLGGAYISWQGHLGGLLGGLATAAVLVLPTRQQRSRWQWPGVAALAIAFLVAIALRAIMLA